MEILGFIKKAVAGMGARGMGIGFILLFFFSGVKASEMDFGTIDMEYNASTGYVLLRARATNTDLNTEYVSAEINGTRGDLSVSTSGFQGLYQFGNNVTLYSDVADMLSSQTAGKDNAYLVLDSNQDYVNDLDGWSKDFNADGSIRVTKDHPLFSGDWLDNINHVNNHTVLVTIAIGSWLYDGDDDLSNFTLDTGSAAIGDAVPYINTLSPITDGLVATDIQGFDTQSGSNYLDLQVVPELVLLGLAGVGATPTVVEDLSAGFSVMSGEGNFRYSVREVDFNSDYFVIDYVLKNPFASANIDTYSINTTKLNTGLGADQAAVDANQQYTILDTGAGGEVFNKWTPTLTPTEITLSTSGLGKDLWTATNSSLDESYGQLRINKTELDANGNGWSQAEVEAGIDYALTADSVDSVLGTAYEGGALGLVNNETGRALRATRFEAVYLSLLDLVPGQEYTVERSGSLDSPDWQAHLSFTAASASEVVKMYVPEGEMGTVFFRVVGE